VHAPRPACIGETKTSHAWVSLSARVIEALEHQARQQLRLGVDTNSGLVFCRSNGLPLRLEKVPRPGFYQ
jgi:hypothetical protein